MKSNLVHTSMRAAEAVPAVVATCEIAPEDGARADVYALIGALFFSPPDSAFLAAISRGDGFDSTADSALGAAWRALGDAASRTDADAVRGEFERAFLGAGIARIPLLGTYYMAQSGDQGPMVRLMTTLSALGFAKRKPVAETEDHLSALCDVMRLLIAGERSRAPQSIEVQHEFFRQQLAPWYGTLCASIRAAGDLQFYRAAAAFTEIFFDIERQCFEMDGQ
jgi:TorA maturation chaperone TorD